VTIRTKLALISIAAAALLGGVGSAAAAPGFTPEKLVVNEYFGVKYQQEPVSWEITLSTPVRAETVRLSAGPCQVEVLDGSREAARKIRVWTLVNFDQFGQQQFIPLIGPAEPATSGVTVEDAATIGGVRMATVGNGQFWARVPVGSITFDKPAPAFDLPGPVASVSADGKHWIGAGYLDSILRVKSVTCEVESGPVFWQSKITYRFEEGKTYTVRVRIHPGKAYAQLVEDFDLGGASKYVFSYEDWAPPWYVTCADQAQTKVFAVAGADSGDFVREEGQRCLVRMVLWTQFGYFGGKSETIGLANEDGSLAVGGFYLRPDRWTRAKVNHVDLYERPEVPGDRMTRGVVGLAGAQKRFAMEAWLIEGHREWALYAMPTGPITPDEKGGPPKVEWGKLRKAHVSEGVWPLDRLNRLTLVWNPDGSPLSPEDSAPTKQAGGAQNVLTGMQGRAGLQEFNGSNGAMRAEKTGLLHWAEIHATRTPRIADIAKVDPKASVADKQTVPAIWAYMAMDESAYPGRRSMLPWTDPEALNPFYQGMENMNFNADRYRGVAQMGAGLAALGHPEGLKMREHGVEQMSMALDRYVYPQSGCWEESHNYAFWTMNNLIPLADTLVDVGARNFYEDRRFAGMFDFWTVAHSPRDPGFDHLRVPPPIGDHGLNLGNFRDRARRALPRFAAAKDPEIQKVARHLRWLLEETDGLGVSEGKVPWPPVPPELQAEKPDLRSRYLQGYGVTLRSTDRQDRESYVVLRAEQSWGHHHQDKGSLWGWFRNVHFFGDAAWGGPPGAHYGNSYKQGPASGTQIELRGVNNWTLPCKYPAPWISDDAYQPGLYDYANARCMYPFNPRLDLSQSTPPATRNGFDRQVLFVHPDLLVVRDNVETTCPTVWRMHSYQADGLSVAGPVATMASPQGVTGILKMAYPDGVEFSRIEAKDELDGDKGGVGESFGKKPGEVNEGGKGTARHDTRSAVLRWDMPRNTSATWTFTVHGPDEAATQTERLDQAGRVTRMTLPDGRKLTVLMGIEPFEYEDEAISFAGTVGLVVRDKAGKQTFHPIRATKLEVR